MTGKELKKSAPSSASVAVMLSLIRSSFVPFLFSLSVAQLDPVNQAEFCDRSAKARLLHLRETT